MKLKEQLTLANFAIDYKIHESVKKLGIKATYNINKDKSIDVFGDVNISHKQLDKIPVKFRIVKGSFCCSSNRLKTLENAPIEVAGDFNCSDNLLYSLMYSPEIVGDYFDCSANKLLNLEHCPKYIGGAFIADNNVIDTLKYFPEEVVGYTILKYNLISDLSTLKRFKAHKGITITPDYHAEVADLMEHFKRTESTELKNTITKELDDKNTITPKKIKI